MYRETDARPTIRVLVIDDEYGARLQVELALVDSEVAELVGQASNGMRGAEQAQELQPDVIVLDLSMPVMDGFEALPLLRTIAPHAVILVRSNHDSERVEQRALALGAARFLPKMMGMDELRVSIEAAVHTARRLTPAGGRAR